jgi:hypothetical protein
MIMTVPKCNLGIRLLHLQTSRFAKLIAFCKCMENMLSLFKDMPYDTLLANRVRKYLAEFPEHQMEEKVMFRGLAFLLNGKMCVNVSGQNLMCRFDPALTEELSSKTGFLQMIMKGKAYKGYCYIEPIGIKSKKDFEFWINLCLDFNNRAKSSKQRKKEQ